MIRSVIFLFLCFVGFPLFSQSSWDELNGKIVNKKVAVEESNGTKHEGTAREVTADQLVLIAQDRDRISLNRSDVTKVKVRSRTRGMLRGLFIGGDRGAIGWARLRVLRKRGWRR